MFFKIWLFVMSGCCDWKFADLGVERCFVTADLLYKCGNFLPTMPCKHCLFNDGANKERWVNFWFLSSTLVPLCSTESCVWQMKWLLFTYDYVTFAFSYISKLIITNMFWLAVALCKVKLLPLFDNLLFLWWHKPDLCPCFDQQWPIFYQSCPGFVAVFRLKVKNVYIYVFTL